MGVRDNKQLETQLLAEWLTSLPRSWQAKTHIDVGAAELSYNGAPLSPARQKAFGVWHDWSDARIFTGVEVWLVEAKLVATGTAYGQMLDYLDEYPYSLDYAQFNFAPRVGIVVCAFSRPRTAVLFQRMGIRTIVFTPSWAGDSLEHKVFGGSTVA